MRVVLAALMVSGILVSVGCYQATEPPTTSETDTRTRGVSKAALLASVCSGCHLAGSDHQGLVSLADHSADDIRTLMMAYRNDDTSQTVMNRLARGYSVEEIGVIAAYLGAEGAP